MSNKGRPPNPDEKSLWDRFVDGIRPMSGKVKDIDHVSKPPKGMRSNNYSPSQPNVHIPRSNCQTQNNLDRKTLSKLQKGKMDIEGKIDLHNKNQDQAYHVLKGFVTRSFAQNKRCLLVVTGKGANTKADDFFTSTRDGVGILKTRLPEWVSVPPLNDMVLRCEPAHKSHGGGGAFYLYLKRNRTP